MHPDSVVLVHLEGYALETFSWSYLSLTLLGLLDAFVAPEIVLGQLEVLPTGDYPLLVIRDLDVVHVV